MKKFFALLILVAVSGAVSVPVLAAENGAGASIEGYIEYESEGTVTVVSRDGDNRVILNITPETRVEDMMSGLPLDLANRYHDRVIAYYGPIMTKSEPPISNAVLILGNVPANAYRENGYDSRRDDQQNGYSRYNGYNFYENYYDNNNGQNGQNGSNGYNGYSQNGYNGYGQNGQNGYGQNGQSGYGQYGYGQNGQNGHSQNGHGQNGRNGYNGQSATPGYTPPVMSLVDALAHVYADFYTVDNVTMAPLRQVAESMGFTVTWNEATRSVTLQHSDGQAFGTVMLDQGFFEGRNLESPPTIRNDRTFVPVSFFEILLGM